MGSYTQEELQAIAAKKKVMSDLDFVRSMITDIGRLAVWFQGERERIPRCSPQWWELCRYYNLRLVKLHGVWLRERMPQERAVAEEGERRHQAWLECIEEEKRMVAARGVA